MSKIIIICLSCLLAFTLGGCDGNGAGKREVGMITGAVLGGALGAHVRGSGSGLAIVGGALLGGYLGGEVGRSMDRADRIRLAHSLEHTRTHQASHWVDPHTGYRYTVVPTRTYRSRGRLCRRFRTSAVIRGRVETVVGTACRKHNGTWQIIR